MAVIQRPAKEGNATTYQGKVAAGYTKILAAEVDADFDTIYAAWNAGVDTVNIKPGAVTAPCLAPGAVTGGAIAPGSIPTAALADGAVTQPKIAAGVTLPPSGGAAGDLSGSYPNPALGVVQSGAVALNPRGGVRASGSVVELEGNYSGNPGYDSSKPSWIGPRIDYAADVLEVWRAPAGTGSWVTLAQLTATGLFKAKAYAGKMIMTGAQPINNGQSITSIFVTAPVDTTGSMTNLGTNELLSPPFNAVCSVSFYVQVSANGGLGVSCNIERWTGSAWQPIAILALSGGTSVYFPLACVVEMPASTRVHGLVYNGSGAAINAVRQEIAISAMGTY